MFGTLKPHACNLGCGRQHEYASFYCGLCKSLGDHYGQVSRALHTYDAVFLALVADGLMDEGAAPDRCRCPMLPVAFRPTVRPDSPAMRYAAAMQMLLADQWLADRAMDGRRAAKAARPMLSGKVETARAVLADLGISLSDLEGFEDRQQRVEVIGETGPKEAAEPTAAALEIVFERMALLPGVTEEGRSAETRRALGAFGRRLGSAIYLVDALDDLEKDQRGGAFNPCLLPGPEVSWSRVEQTWSMLHDDLAALDALSSELPLRRHRDIVRSVVAVELRRLAHEAAKRAHAHARAEHLRRASERRAAAWPRRALAAVAAVFVLVWVWLSSLPALAIPRRPSAPPRPATTTAPSASAPPEQWEPRLPPSSSASSAPVAPPSARPEVPPSPPSTGAPDTGKPGGGTASPSPGPAPSAPTSSDCPCVRCGNWCNGACKGMGGCCSSCKGCDCSSCGNTCNNCGSCGNTCSSCGSCCR